MWTTAKEARAQVQRLWDRGELLREACGAATHFPLRLSLKKPGSADITERFEAVRAWAAGLRNAPPLRIEWQPVRHRVQGEQQLPAALWLDALDDAVRWLDKQADWQRFADLVRMTRQRCPDVLPWVCKYPLQALALHPQWPALLQVVVWVRQHPRPAVYLRQVDAPGVHSKLIETHRAVLAALLDLALPAESIEADSTGVAQFAARYGFLDKPVRIRCRVLDPAVQTLEGLTCPDMTLDVHSFSQLRLAVRRVIITENEINFLSLPSMPGGLAVFGAGYGWDALAQAGWLHRLPLYYWGDIDTHGFAILNQLRGFFPQVRSVLMDRATLEAHRDFWGHEDKPQQADLPHLTATERQLYDALRDNHLRQGLRLEQEHLGFAWVSAQLRQLP